jgi:excisionase family DNA binding protein
MTTPHRASENWLTLLEAAERLSVHPTTLRRWANNGEIPVMLTPGGHRRFAESDVERFADERRGVVKPGSIERAWVDEALSQTRKAIATQHDQESEWLAKFDEEALRQNRMLGQRLMGLILQFVSNGEEGDALLSEARRIGREYGRNAQRIGIPLAEALRTSMFFRDTLMVTTHQMPDSVRIRTEVKLRLLRRINTILNTVQLAVAEVYDAD